jgi:hypothetical protein
VVNAREMSIELIDALISLTTPMGTSIGELLDYNRDKLRDFCDSMPSTRVATSLKERYHRDRLHTCRSQCRTATAFLPTRPRVTL